MAHPYRSKTQGAERAKALTRAEGGKINPSTGARAKFGEHVKDIPQTPGPSREYYGTSGEPGPRGYRLEGPQVNNSRGRTVYPATPEGRKAATRMMDKMDNEYGAYRHRRSTLTDGME